MSDRAPLRVLAIASHPIQYQAPWFRALAQSKALDFQVLFLRLPSAEQQGVGFGQAFRWDVPLTEGYVSRGLFAEGQIPSLWREAWRLWKILRQQRPDALLLTGWHVRGLLLAAIMARVLGLPAVVRGESNALRPRRVHQRLFHRFLLRLYRGFLAVGAANAEFYRRYSVPSSQIRFARYAVDNLRFDRQRSELQVQRASLRATWGISRDSVCFLFAGKLEAKKQPMLFLQALALAFRQSRPISGLVVGEGALSVTLREWVRRENLPVHFAGFLNQSEMAKAYLAADVLVLPSDYGETWGLVVNEAMIFERPAIVSDRVGCGPDLVDDGKTGFRVPFGHSEAVAAAMTRFAHDRALLLRCGRAARERVMTRYSMEQAASDTVAALLSLGVASDP